MPEVIDVLVIHDDAFDRKLIQDTLKTKYRVVVAKSGGEAFGLLVQYKPKLILLAFKMEGMSGKEVYDRLRKEDAWKDISVIFLIDNPDPKVEKLCFDMGAVDFCAKPYVPGMIFTRVERIIELHDLKDSLDTRMEENTQMATQVSLDSIMAIANIIDAKDAYTSRHSVRVAKCAEAIARKLGWSEEEVQNLYYVALLHDIGKMGVPDFILNKPTRLTDEEFALIKRHPLIGNDILKNVHVIKDVATGALYHHERYDGKGYPFGLKGEEIPLCARIIGIADTYDAMTSDRIYRAKLPREKVIHEFEQCAGTQFDPKLSAIFVDMLKEGFHIPEEVRKDGDVFQEVGETENSIMLNKALSEYTAGVQKKGATDPLTGLLNKGNGERRIERLLNIGSRGALLLLDLDNFKGINEQYGHIMGDQVLKILGDTLIDHADARDIVCRLGRDEFLAFFVGIAKREDVREKVEDIRADFYKALGQTGCEPTTTLSAGIALTPQDGQSFTALYNNADKALYFVKKSGKNAYAFYSEDRERGSVEVEPVTDLQNIRTMIEGNLDSGKGALDVEYDEFQRLYNYISRCVKRKGEMVQTLLFTIGNEAKGHLDNAAYEEAMAALEMAVVYSLRMVDVGCRYSSVQYIVILVDSDTDGGKKVAQRVISQFYKIYAGSGIVLSYDIQAMQAGARQGG